jgi:hypothetical protein
MINETRTQKLYRLFDTVGKSYTLGEIIELTGFKNESTLRVVLSNFKKLGDDSIMVKFDHKGTATRVS